MSLPFSKTIGLTKKEAQVYELLLELGEVPAVKIIKKTKLKRATAYKILYSLEKKGLVNKRKLKKKLHFRPEPPTQLLELADEKYQTLKRARQDIRAFIPQLASQYILAVEKPIVSTFEGVKGIKEIYKDTLREKEPLYAVLEPYTSEPEILDWLIKTYVKKRVKAKIFCKTIAAVSKGSQKYAKLDKKSYRETRLVPKDKFPFKLEINIYGDKVAFMNRRKGENLIGVVIKHPRIAQTMKALFDLAWESAAKT